MRLSRDSSGNDMVPVSKLTKLLFYDSGTTYSPTVVHNVGIAYYNKVF